MNAAHPLDEQLSALLDGEAEGAVAAHVEGCDVCGARVELLRAAAAAIATPVAPPPADVKARAIAYAAANGPARSQDWPPSGVARFPGRRRRPPSWLLPAAAAIAAVLLAVPLIASMGSGGGSKKSASATITTSTTALESSSDKALAQAGATTTVAGATETTAAAPTAAAGSTAFTVGSDLGSVTSETDLRARVNAQVSSTGTPPQRAATTTATKATATTAPTCKAKADATAGAGRVEVYQATLRWQGQPATVLGYRRGAEPLFLVVVADGSCAVLLTTNA